MLFVEPKNVINMSWEIWLHLVSWSTWMIIKREMKIMGKALCIVTIVSLIVTLFTAIATLVLLLTINLGSLSWQIFKNIPIQDVFPYVDAKALAENNEDLLKKLENMINSISCTGREEGIHKTYCTTGKLFFLSFFLFSTIFQDKKSFQSWCFLWTVSKLLWSW